VKTFNNSWSSYSCRRCKEPIPALYVKDYKAAPPVVFNTIGFTRHGKTVYLAALFSELRRVSQENPSWADFYIMGLSDDSLENINNHITILREGGLPEPNPKNFPMPTVVKLANTPFSEDVTLLCYDSSGESFEKASEMIKYASFIRKSSTAVFLLSLSNLEDPAAEMEKLLNTYMLGMSELEADTKKQHLIVVFTKADELVSMFQSRLSGVSDYWNRGTLNSLGSPKHYFREMKHISNQLKNFTLRDLGARSFYSMAKDGFKSVTFTMISALGAQPDGSRLSSQISPRHVLAPVLWAVEKTYPKRSKMSRTSFWESLVEFFMGPKVEALPPPAAPAPAALPMAAKKEKSSTILDPSELKAFVSRCQDSMYCLQGVIKQIKSEHFKPTLERLNNAVRAITVNVEKDPRDIRLAPNFPDKVRKICGILEEYLKVSSNELPPGHSVNALKNTETAIANTVDKLESLYCRMLENDAVIISADSKTLESLIDFD